MINPKTPIIMIDTETTNDIDYPLVYDVGYQIFTLADGVLCEKSFVNSDVFEDDDLMECAYFKDKIPAYIREVAEGSRKIAPFAYIKKVIASDCKKFGVEFACAHNAAFDNRALNTTQRYETTSKHRYFLPFGIKWLDTLKMARQTLKDNDSFGEFCYENDYLTKRGCRRYTAEIIYRWLLNDTSFEESHTGLEDVKIERLIFEMLYNLNPNAKMLLWE